MEKGRAIVSKVKFVWHVCRRDGKDVFESYCVSVLCRKRAGRDSELFCMFLSSALELDELLNLEVKSIVKLIAFILGNFG